MKVRVRAQTIRLRLGQVEIDRLRSGKRVEEVIRFGPESSMIWSVEIGEDGTKASLETAPGLLRLFIPPLPWINDESEDGYRVVISCAPDLDLALSVERDYRCLVPRDPVEDLDAFAHPRSGSRC